MKNRTMIGKIVYGVLFCVALPLVLWSWATRLALDIPIPPVSVSLAWLCSVLGALLMAEGMWRLWHDGNGLPMNAYPPLRYVKKGSFALFRHPIYTGFCFLVAGIALITNSAEGFYIVTPIVALLCIALVVGFEQPNLEHRFPGKIHDPLFGMPPDSAARLDARRLVALFFSAFTPWLILYEVVVHLNSTSGFINSMLPFEKNIPVIEWAEIPYVFAYGFVAATPFMLKTSSEARKFLVYSWSITAAGIFLQIVLPFYCKAKDFSPQTFLGEIILWERQVDGEAASLPSFHVLWSLVAAHFWSRSLSKLKLLPWIVAFIITLSCIGTGVHSIADVVSAIVVFVAIRLRHGVLKYLQSGSQRLANSWTAWSIGPLRIINHSLYAGIAAFFGIMLVSLFSNDFTVSLLVVTCSVVGGALWGQLFEASALMLRPFGYFGALLGGVCGLLMSHLFLGADFLTALAVFALAAPWTQAMGRMRCLVQGCCHGRSYTGPLSICYLNDHTRVAKLDSLRGVQIHNTQFYSMIANFAIGVLLMRFWYADAPPTLLAGFYFILTGCQRFIEERFRGEPQTARVAQLSIYQWFAVVFVIAGMFISTLKANGHIVFDPVVRSEEIITAFFGGIVWAFAMGMDFPRSNIRFSRLTG